MPGVGTASAAFAPENSGRDFAAWLGLTPREDSTGGKARLGTVSVTEHRRHVGCSVGETARDGAGARDQASEAGGGWPTVRTAWALPTKKERVPAVAPAAD